MSRRGINPYMSGAWARGLLINLYLHFMELGRWLGLFVIPQQHRPSEVMDVSLRGKIFSAAGRGGFNYFTPSAYS